MEYVSPFMSKVIPAAQPTSLGSEKTNEVGTFFSNLFMCRDYAHLYHLKQPDRKLSTHLVMGSLYEGILGIADSLVEEYQGIYGIVDINVGKVDLSITPEAYLLEVYKNIESTRYMFKESFLQNTIDNICSLIASSLYKIKYVQ